MASSIRLDTCHLYNRCPHDERLGAFENCECPTSECYDLTCGSVISKTAQEFGATTNQDVKQAFGDCEQAQVAPKVQHSFTFCGPVHGCIPSGKHPR